MKVITWNCNMAFRNKVNAIIEQKPDILVIPECEHTEKLRYGSETFNPNSSLWFGRNRSKGLGIFSFNGYTLSPLDCHNPSFQIIVPILVTRGPTSLILIAIWANNPADKEGRYIEQVWKAIEHYDELLNNAPTLLVGDFNSNSIWDTSHKMANHSKVVSTLERKGIFSCYHLFHKLDQGREIHPTLYMYRNQDKGYHIDYCFVSKELAEKIELVEVGKFAEWSMYSDHVPVIITFRHLDN